MWDVCVMFFLRPTLSAAVGMQLGELPDLVLVPGACPPPFADRT